LSKKLPGEARINSPLNDQGTPNNSILEKMRFLFCFIFNDLQSLKMAAHPYAAETLSRLWNKRAWPGPTIQSVIGVAREFVTRLNPNLTQEEI
jgi:hypothetical protein